MSTPVNLRGRLIADPEIRFSQNGKPIARFTVVTSKRVKNTVTGEWEETDSSFWDCTAFGQLAENIGESAAKGDNVIVSGQMKQEKWETKEGEKRSSFKVTVDDLGVSLRWVQAQIQRPEKKEFAQVSAKAYSQEPPF